MKAKGVRVALSGNTPGFALPTNIGELGDDITTLDLSNCSLTGTIVCPSTHALYVLLTLHFFAGELTKELGNLVNLKVLELHGNGFTGTIVCPIIHALCVC